jgi:hypothetical protein
MVENSQESEDLSASARFIQPLFCVFFLPGFFWGTHAHRFSWIGRMLLHVKKRKIRQIQR